MPQEWEKKVCFFLNKTSAALNQIAGIHFLPRQMEVKLFSDLLQPAEPHSITRWHFVTLRKTVMTWPCCRALLPPFFFSLPSFFKGYGKPPSWQELIDASGGWLMLTTRMTENPFLNLHFNTSSGSEDTAVRLTEFSLDFSKNHSAR